MREERIRPDASGKFDHLLFSIALAPRALVSRIDGLTICASPKASCRSVADFAWEVANSKAIRVTVNANLIVFRNPYRRLISAFLNKYVEHHKYLEASLQRSPKARLDTFAAFVAEHRPNDVAAPTKKPATYFS